MIKRILLLLGTVVLVVVGAAMFAAFESHVIDVKAHVEKATYVTPDDLDFGTTIMQQSYHKSCTPDGTGDCMKIHLSASFITQEQYQAVDYNIYCEGKALLDPDRADGNITPFLLLSDSDPLDPDSLNNPNGAGQGCGSVAYGTDPATLNPVLWAHGVLDKSFDTVDLWDIAFWAPLCSDNYNPETDPATAADLAGRPGGGLIDASYCHKDPGMVDSDEYFDLASNVKFQVTQLETH